MFVEHGGRLRVTARSTTARNEAIGPYERATLEGSVYRDPSGFDVHVAQSDVAACEVTLATRRGRFDAWGTPRRLAGARSAVEVHRLAPLEGVRYVPWDGTRPIMVGR